MRTLSFLRNVRARLTLAYVAAMIVVLGVYAAGVYGFVSHNVSRSLDGQLRADYMWAAEMWDERGDGSLTWFDQSSDDPEDNPWLQVWSESAGVLFRTSVAQRVELRESESLAQRATGAIVRVDSDGMPYRVLSRRAVINGRPVVIQVARSEAPMARELRDLLLILLLGLPVGVVVSALGGYALAREALAPVGRMAERARTITAERLDDRLPVDNPGDELGGLAAVFNLVLERLEQSFQQMQHFTADVSHELRTPLTAIRTVGEVALRESRAPEAYRTTIGSMLEEVEHLTGLVERLLALSRADAGLARMRVERFDLADVADEVAAYLQVLADERQQTIAVRRAGPAPCQGDRLMVRQAVVNLVDNAIKYGPEGSEVRIELSRTPTTVTMDVVDGGPGIDPVRGARIFDRFARGHVDNGTRGHGLGLSIALAAIKANHGSLTWEPLSERGTVFRLALPINASGLESEPRLQPAEPGSAPVSDVGVPEDADFQQRRLVARES